VDLVTAECREGRLVGSVEPRAASSWATVSATAGASSEVTTTATATATPVATELSTAAAGTATGAATSTACAWRGSISKSVETSQPNPSLTTVTGVSSSVVLAVDDNLLLLRSSILGLAGLATGTSHEVLVRRVACECLALGELLLGTLVGLANFNACTERGTLLFLLGKVLLVGFGLVLLLGSIGTSLAVWSSGESGIPAVSVGSSVGVVLCFSVGDGVAGLLVGPLGIATLTAPSLSSLLLLFAVDPSISFALSIFSHGRCIPNAGVAVTVVTWRTVTTASTSSSTTTSLATVLAVCP
jgi:hypothetical protein